MLLSGGLAVAGLASAAGTAHAYPPGCSSYGCWCPGQNLPAHVARPWGMKRGPRRGRPRARRINVAERLPCVDWSRPRGGPRDAGECDGHLDRDDNVEILDAALRVGD